MDLKAAFDSVNHEILFENLSKKGIPVQTLNSIKYIYSRIQITTDLLQDPIPVNKGVL